MENGATRKKLWIDCDAGVDDAQGLMLALAAPGVDVVGISIVHGNVDVTKVSKNVARILTLCDRQDIPYYVGADEPLLGQPMDASFFHGEDGLGDVPSVAPAYDTLTLEPAAGIAAVKLSEAAQHWNGCLEVVAIGPLTNIALACKLDQNFPKRVAALYVMGGAETRGNISPTAEFNFHCDPEAAHLVLKKFHNTVMVTWDCTMAHALPWSLVDRWLETDTPKGRFANAASKASVRLEKSRGYEGWVVCDPYAVAIACCSEVMMESKLLSCTIEVQGSALTRGQSVFDWNNILGGKPNVQLVTKIDVDAFQKLLFACVH
ncbi:hypothetical protein WJX72_005766 [[Myrmecia] bisecta]|uniref:Inosine/uridine-preferring nucleoside hydrolase domain-containing protein n=1 Tax=[Myrmecia] bisecta TaxID=41462 RepID=A0AAW1PXA6_9CHLO